jgi:hypothetical protein
MSALQRRRCSTTVANGFPARLSIGARVDVGGRRARTRDSSRGRAPCRSSIGFAPVETRRARERALRSGDRCHVGSSRWTLHSLRCSVRISA